MLKLPGRCVLAASLVVPVLLVGVTACSEDDDKEPSASESTPTDAATSATDEQHEQGDPVGDPARLIEDVKTAIAAESNAHVQFKLGTGAAEGTMAFGGEGDSALELTLSDTTNEYTMRYVGGAMYVAFPGLTAPGKFIKVERDGSTLGVDIDVDSYRDLGPVSTLDAISQTVTRVGDLGQEEIDGIETTHYSVTVDAAKARELEGTQDEPGTEALPDTVTYDLFVTEDNLLRRIQMNLSENFPIELNYTGWSEQQPVVAPAKKDLIELPPDLGETP